MERIWQQIELWLEEHAPHILASFNEGVSEDDLNALEDALGLALPNDVRQFYKIRNGQTTDDPPVLFDGMFYMLTLADIQATYQVMGEVLADMAAQDIPNESQEDSIEVQSYWWHDQWIPLFSNGAGDLWCIDLDPTDYGKKGQIIEFWHDDVGRTLVSKNLRTLMKQFAFDLENEQYIVESDGLLHVDIADEDDVPNEFDADYNDVF